MDDAEKIAQREKLRDIVLRERDAGKIVFWGLPGDPPSVAKLDDFIKQPADGMLYDLNRLEEVTLTFIDDPKWLNDFAVAAVIRRLVAEIERLRSTKPVSEDQGNG